MEAVTVTAAEALVASLWDGPQHLHQFPSVGQVVSVLMEGWWQVPVEHLALAVREAQEATEVLAVLVALEEQVIGVRQAVLQQEQLLSAQMEVRATHQSQVVAVVELALMGQVLVMAVPVFRVVVVAAAATETVALLMVAMAGQEWSAAVEVAPNLEEALVAHLQDMPEEVVLTPVAVEQVS